jgi:hypothetical protein
VTALLAASAQGRAVAGPSGYSFAPVASLGDAAPGGGEFTFDFEPSAINNSGAVAFTADVTTGGEGAFVAGNGKITQLARTGSPAPGDGIFGSTELGRMGLNDAGDAVVAFSLDGWAPPDNVSGGLFRFSRTTGTLTADVLPGMPAPGGGTFQGVLYNTDLNNLGSAVLWGLASGTDLDPSSPPGFNGIGSGVYRADAGGALSSVVRPGDPAPGGGVFDAAWNPSLNDRGDVAFGGHVAGEPCLDFGLPFFCGESVYLKDGTTGSIRSIAHVGDPAPGGGHFTVAFGALVNNRGDVVFLGDLAPYGSNAVLGVFRYSKGSIMAVARPGTPMPGGGHLATASLFVGTFGLNNSGDVGFAATLDTDDNHDGIADSGVYVWSNGSLRLVARSGMVIPGLGEIAFFGFVPPSASFPWPIASGGMLNNRGQVILFAMLTDGTGVLLVATP